MTKEYRERLLKHYKTIEDIPSYIELKKIIEGKQENLKEDITEEDG